MVKTYILFLVFILVTTVACINVVLAQGPPPPPPPPSQIPIDGGVSLLVAAGVAYGAKKVYDNKKKK